MCVMTNFTPSRAIFLRDGGSTVQNLASTAHRKSGGYLSVLFARKKCTEILKTKKSQKLVIFFVVSRVKLSGVTPVFTAEKTTKIGKMVNHHTEHDF